MRAKDLSRLKDFNVEVGLEDLEKIFSLLGNILFGNYTYQIV
jgi:hypothetical protein